MFDNMSDIEFRGGVCGGTRWNIPATTPFANFSPCPNLETFDRDIMGIFSKSNIDVHEDDQARVISYSGLNDIPVMDSSFHMEDWRQPFNVHGGGGGGGGRPNHQQTSQIHELQEHTIMMSSRLSNNNLHQNNPFSLDEESYNNINNTTTATTTTQHDLIDVPYGFSSELLQTLFEDNDDEDLVLNESIFENRPALPINYRPCTNNNSPPIPKRPAFDPSGLISDHAPPPLWNPSSDVAISLNDNIRANNFFPNYKVTPTKVASEASGRGVPWSSTTTMKKNQCDRQTLKRSRLMETPSPLPSFKVRKEKLGDRITALQQLVSPFGKTDTASVLHEAIDYIKFLHNQVNVLSSPYSKNCGENTRTNELSLKKDLKSRGLCLVPLSSTIPVAIETTRAAEFWTPNFGVGFK